MDNVGMYTPVCVCVCIYEEKKSIHVCRSFLNTHTQTHTHPPTHTSSAQWVCSNPLRSYSTGSRVHGQPSQQARVPLVIQVFEFAACEGIQASMWHSGICTFCCFSVSVLSVTQSYGSVLLYRSPGAASCSFNIPGTSTPAPSCRSPCVALIDKRPLLSGA